MKNDDMIRFVKVAEAATQHFITLPENPKPDRTGGYIVVFSKAEPKILLLAEFGTCLPDRIKTGLYLCQEKAKRLIRHKRHNSSWQSRNPERRKYGGAITSLTSPYVGGMSGFVEHGDEAILLVIWHLMGWLPIEEATQIAAFSENSMFLPLLKQCEYLEKIN